MSVEEKIIQHVYELPEAEKAEVLDFIEYLKAKIKKKESRDWAEFSLSSAMRGMEDEPSPYSAKDLLQERIDNGHK